MRTLLFNKWVIQVIGLIAVVALIWFVGPLLAIAKVEPLASEGARAIAIVLLILFWVIFLLVSHLRAQKREQNLAQALSAQEGTGDGVDEAAEASAEELSKLRRNFDDALQLLRKARSSGKAQDQYIYELPWYIIIGAPGSGKTTALLNSGLQFPLAEHLGQKTIKGVSGTRNCDWLFTDQAVFIDTAGRYTTQDSHKVVDATAWQGFLELLKKHRPQRPINGALIAYSLADLLQQTEEERALHARAIRQRAMELYQALGITIPIYLLFTKCDLVAGFTDFFADFGHEERTQVWGDTFPAHEADNAPDLAESFSSQYGELVQRLQKRTLARVHGERDIQRRATILDFPQQMALVQVRIAALIRDAFGTNRYQNPLLLRGVYLTSGTQEGSPIDRILGQLASIFRFDRQASPMFSGQGKSFFITRLLKDVIFHEAELAGVDVRIARRRRLMQWGIYAGAALSILCLGLLWTSSYFANRNAVDDIQARINEYNKTVVKPGAWSENFRSLLPKLDALRQARDVYADPGWSMGWGLYQGDMLQEAASSAYARALQNGLLPLIHGRLAQRLQQGASGRNDVYYELLKAYLMLGEEDHGKFDAKAVRPWVLSDWGNAFAVEPKVLAGLTSHLDALLALPPDAVPVKPEVVSMARALLSQVPQLQQIYGRYKNEALLEHGDDLHVGQLLGAQVDKVFDSVDGHPASEIVIPGIFTSKGFTQSFLKDGISFVRDAASQNWVMGTQKTGSEEDVPRLYAQFQQLYLADYQKAWDNLLLVSLQMYKAANINRTTELLNILSGPDTPLRPLLETVDKNTSLARLSTQAAETLNAAASGTAVQSLASKAEQLAQVARLASGGGEASAIEPLRAVERHFESLNMLARGTPPPITNTISAINGLLGFAMQMGQAADTGGQALKTVTERMAGGGNDVLRQAQLDFSRLPEPLRAWLMSLTRFSWGQTLGNARGELNEMVKSAVGIPCKQALQGRYPFSRSSSQDVNLADFARFIAPNGVIDQFFQANLKNLVDTNKPQWTSYAMDNQSLGLSTATINQFQNAAKIRNAFFPLGATSPTTTYELKLVHLGSGSVAADFDMEGQPYKFQNPGQVASFRWPGPSNASGVRVSLADAEGKQKLIAESGNWALFHLLDKAGMQSQGSDRFQFTVQADGASASFELHASSVENPFNLAELHGFQCPDRL